MRKLAHILLGFIWMLIIIPLAVSITLYFKPLYYADVVTQDISGRSGMSVAEIRENYDELIRYNTFTGPKTLKFPTLAMSETGRIHFQEVKRIFLLFQTVGICAFVAAVPITLVLRKSGEYEYLKWAGIFTVLLPAVLGVLVAVSWDKFFVLFHKVLFNNDYWIFDAATDPVIMILPDTFFMHAMIMILALVIIGALFCFDRYRTMKKRAGYLRHIRRLQESLEG